MFAHAYQSGFVSLLYSFGSKPLQLWEKHSHGGGDGVRRVLDDEIQSAVVELGAADGEDGGDAHALIYTWLRCPAHGVAPSLHIRLPQLVFQLKPMRSHCSIEVVVEDHARERRRFRMSTFQRATVVHERITLLPLRLDGVNQWNQVQLDLPEMTHEAYASRYVHTVSVQIHAHCRVRRVFFAERMRAEDTLPAEFRLFKRLTKQQVAQCKASPQ